MKGPLLLIVVMLVALAAGGYFVFFSSASEGESQSLALVNSDSSAAKAKDKDAEADKAAKVATAKAAEDLRASEEAKRLAAEAAKAKPEFVEGNTEPNGSEAVEDAAKDVSKKIDTPPASSEGSSPTKPRSLNEVEDEIARLRERMGVASNLPKTPFTATVSGSVVDESDQPMVGVSIKVIPVSDSGSVSFNMTRSGNGEVIRQSSLGGDTSDLNGNAISDGMGAFSMAMNGQMLEKAESGKIALRMTAPSLGEYDTEGFSIRRSGTRDSLIIKLYQRVTVSGVVLNKRDSKPFVGAKVELDYSGADWAQQKDNLLSLSYKAEDQTVGEDGRFRFEGVPGGQMSVSASVPSPASNGSTFRMVTKVAGQTSNGPSASESFVASRGENPKDLTLYLESQASLLFRIAQSDATSVRARLNSSSGFGVLNMIGGMSGDTLLPDADGVYRVAGLTSETSSVDITAQGYAKTNVDVKATSGEDLDLGTITLKTGALVEGTVTNSAGEPIAGVKVYLPESGGGGGIGSFVLFGNGMSSGAPSATTDSNGAFAIEGVAVGSHQLRFEHSDYATGEAGVLVEEGRNPARLAVTLTQGGTLRGHVELPSIKTEGSEGGMRGSFVALVEPGERDNIGFGSSIAISAAQSKIRSSLSKTGPYKIERVPAGEYSLYATHMGRELEMQKIRIVDGQETIIDLRFPADGTLEGVITDHDGTPYANRQVTLKPSSMMSFGGTNPSVKTDASGRYFFAQVPSAEYIISLDKDPQWIMGADRITRLVAVGDGERATKDLDLSKSEGVTLKGQVTLGGKAAFGNLSLTSVGGQVRSVVMDGKGNFEATELTPGKYYAWFQSANQGEAMARLNFIVPEEGEEDIEINRDFSAATLNGSVVGGGDIDRNLITITARPILDEPYGRDPYASWMKASTKANAEGKFSFTLPQGEYEISISHPDFAPTSTRVVMSGQMAQNFEVGGAAGKLKIVIKAMLKDGKPYEASGFNFATYRLLDAAGELVTIAGTQSAFMLGGSGTFHEVPSLAAGSYTLELTASPFETARVAFDIRADETTEKEVTLIHGAFHTITLGNDGLDAVKLAGITTEIYDANTGKRVTAGSGVSFGMQTEGKERKIGPLSAGTYRIVISVKDFLPYEETVTVTQGSTSASTAFLTPKPKTGE